MVMVLWFVFMPVAPAVVPSRAQVRSSQGKAQGTGERARGKGHFLEYHNAEDSIGLMASTESEKLRSAFF